MALKTLFKLRDDTLTFAKATQVALGTEEVTKVAKETAYGQASNSNQFIKWSNQRIGPAHLKLLRLKPRLHLKGSRTSHFQRDPVTGVRRKTTLVKISHTLMMFVIIKKYGSTS